MLQSNRKPPVWARAFLIFVLLMLWLPIAVMFFNSLDFQSGELLQFYQQVFNDEALLQALQISLHIALSSAAVSTVLGLSGAYAIHRTGFAWKKFLLVNSYLAMLIPELVFALALLTLFGMIHFPLGPTTVLVAHVSFSLSFSIFVLSSRLQQLDIFIEEAAADLGANSRLIFFKVILPQIYPSLFVSLLLCFLLSFDDFLITYFVNGVGTDTLPIKLFTSMRIGHSPKLSALSMLLTAGLMFLAIAIFMYRNIRDFAHSDRK